MRGDRNTDEVKKTLRAARAALINVSSPTSGQRHGVTRRFPAKPACFEITAVLSTDAVFRRCAVHNECAGIAVVGHAKPLRRLRYHALLP